LALLSACVPSEAIPRGKLAWLEYNATQAVTVAAAADPIHYDRASGDLATVTLVTGFGH
tara:strand:- start:136 stop:312 length:177 start_codon:yes stop_codon:yes gene_type:complete